MNGLVQLSVKIPTEYKEVIMADSKALGIPAYKLVSAIVEDHIFRSAIDRKKIYLRKKNGNYKRK